MVIVPRPQKMISFDGVFSFNGKLITSNENYEKIKNDAAFFNIDVEIGTDGRENLFFYNDLTLREEEYELSVDVCGIKIITSSYVGVFRALSTLRQILQQKSQEGIPCLKINDFPDIPVRGIMLCVSSRCIYKMETLYYMVDRLAELKYNMMQLYFDTFVFEYDSFRKHLDGKAYYTKEQIQTLDKYCKERHIELMANVETFGHLSQLLSCDEYKHLGITRDGATPFTINPLMEESFDVIKQMLDDLLPNFSSTTVNIGMDETYGMGENETAEYCKTFGVEGLFIDFVKKVSGYIKEKHGKRSMIWGDMAAKYPHCIGEIPKDVIYVDWGYEPGHKFDRNAIACKEHGLDVYVSPGTHQWGTITGRTDVMIQNIFFSAESARNYGAKGFLLTDWTVKCTPVLTMLAFAYGGAFSWNSGYSTSFTEAHNEMDCTFRNMVSDDVLYYYDRFIVKSRGISCADIVFRMGNYWFMEQPRSVSTWNGTVLYKNFFQKDYEYSMLDNRQLKRIKDYMMGIKDELSECSFDCENSDLIMTELVASVDLVIFAAEALMKNNCKDYDEIETDIEKLKDDYKYLYDKHFHTLNKNTIIGTIDKWTEIL